jgi:hypothetical protein
MKQRQVLRQLAEAGQLRLQDFDAAGLARLLRQELITVTGQTVTLTAKGHRLAAPRKSTVRAGKPPHPLPPPQRSRPIGASARPSKRGYYAAQERSRRQTQEWLARHPPPPIDWSTPTPSATSGSGSSPGCSRNHAATTTVPSGPRTTTSAIASAPTSRSPRDRCWWKTRRRMASRSGMATATGSTTTRSSSPRHDQPAVLQPACTTACGARLAAPPSRLHRDEEAKQAKELRIPLSQLRVTNAKGRMFDLTRLPIDEQKRQAKLLSFARQGLRYVYTLNSNGLLRTLHQVPNEDDLLALPSHAASILWCTELWFYVERKPDSFMPATLGAHNAAIQQLIDHPKQRERLVTATSSILDARIAPAGTTRSRTQQKPTTALGMPTSVGTAPTNISLASSSSGSWSDTMFDVANASAVPSVSAQASPSSNPRSDRATDPKAGESQRRERLLPTIKRQRDRKLRSCDADPFLGLRYSGVRGADHPLRFTVVDLPRGN